MYKYFCSLLNFLLHVYLEKGPKRQATTFPCVTLPANGHNICKVEQT